MRDSYTVYDNETNKIVASGTFAEIENYYENSGRYTVVDDNSGIFVNQ